MVKKKKKAGQPTKYKPGYCDELVKFFDIEPFEDIELPHYQKDGKTLRWTDFKRMPSRLPTLRRFAKKIKVGISSIYRWLDENNGAFQPKFRDAFTHAKEIRKEFLIENGLQGLYPPLSFKFVAINLTDMKDKTESDNRYKIDGLKEILELIDGKNKGLPDKAEIESPGQVE